MLTRIQALNYRCLKRVDQSLTSFEVLVGGNGVGKSTFLDVVCLIGEIVRQPRNGLASAFQVRSGNFEDLLFDKAAGFFELAVESTIPESVASKTKLFGPSSVVRFQIKIGFTDTERTRIGIHEEQLLLRRSPSRERWVNPGTKRQDGTIPFCDEDSILEASGFSLRGYP